jgi:uncharacterized protein YidB (DUF937 family)
MAAHHSTPKEDAMGLFDQIAGQVLGSLANSGDARQAGLIEVIAGLINNPQTGGLSGLIGAFERGGLSSVVSSWVGTGANLPVSPEQVQSVLGDDRIAAMAQQLGFSQEELSGHLSQLLPQVIDKLTPNGEVPQDGGLATLGGLLDAFKGAQP